MPDATPLSDLLTRLEREGIRPGLADTAALLADLGDPQRAWPAVLVAGTNGKGSTSALLAAILAAAGRRVGHYTSPHLERAEERIRVAGRPVPAARLVELLEQVVRTAVARGRPTPTYFEAMTVAAFLHFAHERIDLAVLEVGMGGRLDATNLADPRLSLVTSIDLDHREYLGETLGAIAREKAGVFRSGRPALMLARHAEALAALRASAAACGADLRDAAPEVARTAVLAEGWDGQRLRIDTGSGPRQLWLPLAGRHQAANLTLAVLAAEELARLGLVALETGTVERGVASCRWPGRLERIELPGGGAVLLDAAHNPAGIARLVEFLAAREARYVLLFGALADKEVGEMLPPLLPRALAAVLTEPESPRALPAAALARAVPPTLPVRVVPDRPEALRAALALGAEHGSALVVAAGSIYLIGELRVQLRHTFGVPAPV